MQHVGGKMTSAYIYLPLNPSKRIFCTFLRRFADVNEESPPEPAPPEVPPRGPSLHSATLRRRADYNLPVGEPNQNGQETNASSQFLSQGGE